jgi:hypothetical protein
VPFSCSICEQESTRICASCTKDSCDNHLCGRCGCCSDCCECDLPLDEATPHLFTVPATEPEPVIAPESAIAPETTPAPEIHTPVADSLPPADIDEV